MEAAVAAANSSETIACSNVSITFWPSGSGPATGKMTFTREFCQKRKIIVDFNKEKSASDNNDEDNQKPIQIDDYVCIRCPGAEDTERICICHGNLISYENSKESGNKLIVKFEVKESNKELLAQLSILHGCTVEFLQKAIPDR